MKDATVVLRRGDPIGFVEDVCALVADAVSQVRPSRPIDGDLVAVYAELVAALARLRRAELAAGPRGEARVNIVDHLLMRLEEAQTSDGRAPLIDVVDRLHGE